MDCYCGIWTSLWYVFSDVIMLQESLSFLILGVGTDIGKTYFIEKLCKKLTKNKREIKAIKPIISGFKINDLRSDSARILTSLSQEASAENIKKISPWRLKKAISPHLAAAKENQKIDFNELIQFCKNQIAQASKNEETLLIEGAGGIMTPINNSKTFCDLAVELQIPVILVTNNYLGSISHTLSAIAVLRQNNINISYVIANDFSANDSKSDTSIEDFASSLSSFSSEKIITLSQFIEKVS